ncbi:hypothetical protein [Stenotrophomonas acidaminiphila]|uniref:hypothetical protein n=1 Tax=Stenotrophomonas acidaminiphila TaxID=128780 RepID=UPI001E57DF78|nr:hypothetical protein [Stenotrophomonas acidaminiphila]
MQAIQRTKKEGFGTSDGQGVNLFPGHIMRTYRGITVRPVRNVGPRDSEVVELAVKSFGYLLPTNAIETLAGFASRIELACSNPKARAVADTLHRLSA